MSNDFRIPGPTPLKCHHPTDGQCDGQGDEGQRIWISRHRTTEPAQMNEVRTERGPGDADRVADDQTRGISLCPRTRTGSRPALAAAAGRGSTGPSGTRPPEADLIDLVRHFCDHVHGPVGANCFARCFHHEPLAILSDASTIALSARRRAVLEV